MIAVLQKVPLFAGLNDSALGLLTSQAQVAEYATGELIVREGEPGNRLFLIESGRVEILKRFGQPHQRQVALLESGDFFGEMSILESQPRAATVRALDFTRLLALSSGAFYHLYKAMPEQYSILILNLARDLSRRLRRLDESLALHQGS